MMGPARRRRGSQLALVGLIVGLAWPVAAQSEQPVDPYAQPTPTPTPTPADPDAAAEAADLDEKVAAALHDRGVHLFGADQLAGAKEMFIESLERSPSGATAIEALRMLRQTNQRLGVANLDDGRPAGAGGAGDGGPVDPYGAAGEDTLDPYAAAGAAPTGPGVAAGAAAGPAGRGALYTFGAAYGLLGGLALAGPEGDDGEVGAGAVVLGALGAAAGVGAAWLAEHRVDLDGGQRAAVIAGGALGGLAIGLLTDSLTGEEADGFATEADDLYRGAALGGLLGLGGGAWWARAWRPSVGDVAVVQSVALYGAGTGMLLGLAMDPPHNEAITLNGALGTAAGFGAGLFLAGRVETTRARMLWVDLGAAAGAAVPWILIYPLAKDDGTSDDEQALGLVSSLGLIGGAAAAWYFTRDLDPPAGPDPAAGRAAAVVERDRAGRWRAGVPLPRPLGGPDRGVAVDLAVGRF